MKEQKDVQENELANGVPDNIDMDKLPKVSAVFFDEKTGTITLKIATEEEIAEVNKLTMNR